MFQLPIDLIDTDSGGGVLRLNWSGERVQRKRGNGLLQLNGGMLSDGRRRLLLFYRNGWLRLLSWYRYLLGNDG